MILGGQPGFPGVVIRLQHLSLGNALVWPYRGIDQQRKGVRLLASLSTCVQFAPGSEEFQVDHEAPGYRWLRLYPDGRLETAVSRVTDIDFEIDYTIKGY